MSSYVEQDTGFVQHSQPNRFEQAVTQWSTALCVAVRTALAQSLHASVSTSMLPESLTCCLQQFMCCVAGHWSKNPRILNIPTGYQILSRPFVNAFLLLCRKGASSFPIYFNDIFVLSKNLCSCPIKSSGQLTASSVLWACAPINKFCWSIKTTPSRDSWETAI